MSEKKMVSRNVAIVLGIICVLLVAIIAYFSIIGISAQNSYNNLQNQNKQLQANNTNLQNEINNLTDALNLQESTVWVDGGTVNIMNSPPTYEENASFAGYVAFQVSTQNNVSAEVEVSYFSHGVNYANSIVVGSSGTAVFPVLPSSSISIYIFQGGGSIYYLTGPLYATVTITYYY
jgi:hypothetical protein